MGDLPELLDFNADDVIVGFVGGGFTRRVEELHADIASHFLVPHGFHLVLAVVAGGHDGRGVVGIADADDGHVQAVAKLDDPGDAVFPHEFVPDQGIGNPRRRVHGDEVAVVAVGQGLHQVIGVELHPEVSHAADQGHEGDLFGAGVFDVADDLVQGGPHGDTDHVVVLDDPLQILAGDPAKLGPQFFRCRP